jgi:murein DD-endopeptidase MepM/ murein hydrolase activator NlpD
MGQLSRIALLLAAVTVSGMAVAEAPLWPLPEDPIATARPYVSFLQPTVSGKPESALFGCVRTDGKRFHEAADLAPVLPRKRGEATDPVTAIHDGVVAHVSRVSGNSSYGRYVVLEHPGLDLSIFSLYSHLASVEGDLAPGDPVKAGERLGIMGRSAGGYTIPRERAHLHLEIGLRLSGDFEQWYRRQSYDSPNKHGNFNGMNLIGWDPIAYFEAFRDGKARSALEFLEQLPPAVMVHVYSPRRPDFAGRYPELVLPGCPPGEQAGWEVLLSPWGLPLSLKPLARDELKGVSKEGDISIVGVDRKALGAFACRRIISESNGKVSLGRGGQTVMEILFMPDRHGK